ncbi:hypothetical protein L596_027035 [Steinernema carpocapsae]|nr:hypothetical protein L596_027035 [Steinernema carpocapsae]
MRKAAMDVFLHIACLSSLFGLIQASPVPEGCWTDRLVEVPKTFNAPLCSSEDSLVEWANDNCGQQVLTYSFGPKCKTGLGGPMYADIRFTCCKAQDDKNFVAKEVAKLETNAAEALEHLKEYLCVLKNVSYAEESGDKSMADNIMHDLKDFGSYVGRVREEEKKQKQEHNAEKFFENYKPGAVVSGRQFAHSIMAHLLDQASIRSRTTFEVILSLIEKDKVLYSKPEKQQLLFDLRRTKFNYAWETAIMSPRNELFPEIEADMNQFYINVLKQSTIGITSEELTFLGASDSTEKLVKLYQLILDEERWTHERLLTSMGLLVLWVVSAVLFFIIAGACIKYRRKQKQEGAEISIVTSEDSESLG